MTIDEFDAALRELNWKVSDFCRQTGLHRNTPSRWRTGEVVNVPDGQGWVKYGKDRKPLKEVRAVEIPLWVEKFLGMALELKRLHDQYILPPKGAPANEPDA